MKGIRDAEAGLVASYMPTNGGFCEDLLKCGFTPVILVWIRLKTWFFNLIYSTPDYHQQQRSQQTRQLPAAPGWKRLDHSLIESNSKTEYKTIL